MTDTAPAAPGGGSLPVTIAVLGSCITRDNFNTQFNPGYKQWYQTVLMQNQSSLISLMSPPVELPEDQVGTGSDYDKWNVRTDFSRQFLGELAELAPDYLILDFFGDVHFGCLRLDDGRYLTNNRWKLWPTPYYKGLKQAGPLHELSLHRDTDEYLRLWQEAFDRLTELLREVVPDTTVVIHRGHNVAKVRLADTGKTVDLQKHADLARIDVPRYNELWSRLDDYAVSSTGFAAIDLTGGDYPTFEGHPWGPYYVHYAEDYYVDFLTELNRLHLGRVLGASGPAQAAMLDQVIGRIDERAAAERERQQAVVQRLRSRVKKLEQRVRTLERRSLRAVAGKVRRRLAGLRK